MIFFREFKKFTKNNNFRIKIFVIWSIYKPSLGSAVLMLIGYKQTSRHQDKQSLQKNAPELAGLHVSCVHEDHSDQDDTVQSVSQLKF